MHSKLKIRCLRLLALMMSIAAIQVASTAPRNEASRREINVQNVRLVGVSFEKAHEDVFARVVEYCLAEGKTPETRPPGEPVHQVVYDDYYALGGATRHIRTRTYSIQLETCKLKLDETHKVRMVTASGTCSINPKRKRAVGYCDTRSLLEGKRMPILANPSVKPTGETLAIAGAKCSVWEGGYGGLNRRECLALSDDGVGMSHDGMIRRPGLVLKAATWVDENPDEKTTDLEAVAVKRDIKVGLTVLAPHAAGGYEVIESGRDK